MTSESEQRPHVVYRAGDERCAVLPDYAQAHAQWTKWHTWQEPFEIAVLGRHCTPAAAVVDVGE